MVRAPHSAGLTHHLQGVAGVYRSRQKLLGRIATGVLVILGVVWFFTLRPTLLGGSTSYVTVSGVSMEPTYHQGDLVILRKLGSYAKGDIIAYHIPLGNVGAGSLVIHRVVGQDAQGYITKGDNRNSEDMWRPQESDIVGRAWVHIANGGSVVAYLREPFPIATIAAILTIYVVLSLWDGESESRKGPQ